MCPDPLPFRARKRWRMPPRRTPSQCQSAVPVLKLGQSSLSIQILWYHHGVRECQRGEKLPAGIWNGPTSGNGHRQEAGMAVFWGHDGRGVLRGEGFHLSRQGADPQQPLDGALSASLHACTLSSPVGAAQALRTQGARAAGVLGGVPPGLQDHKTLRLSVSAASFCALAASVTLRGAGARLDA